MQAQKQLEAREKERSEGTKPLLQALQVLVCSARLPFDGIDWTKSPAFIAPSSPDAAVPVMPDQDLILLAFENLYHIIRVVRLVFFAVLVMTLLTLVHYRAITPRRWRSCCNI